MSSASNSPREFATTHWSLVLAAGRRPSPESDRALAALCAGYWFPLYAFLRRHTGDEHRARDLTQDFFAHLLEKNALAAADPGRGRFRAFLLTAARNFLASQWARGQARKRGRPPLSLDFAWGEERYHQEPADPWTPEKLFDRQWTLVLLEQVFARLRADYEAQGKSALFDRLKVYLTGDAPGQSYAAAAQDLGLREGAVKVAVHRLRRRYRDLLRAEVAHTVGDQADIDDEIRALFRSLEA